MPLLQAYQVEADDGSFMDYAGDGRILPENAHDWDWFDNKFATDWLCSKVKTSYKEETKYEPLGKEPWTETTEFPYSCEVMPFYDADVLRIHFWIPYGDESYKAEFVNNSTTSQGLQNRTEDQLRNANFTLKSDAQTSF